MLIAKSIIKFVKIIFLNFERQSGSNCATSVLRDESKVMKKIS